VPPNPSTKDRKTNFFEEEELIDAFRLIL